MDRKTNEFVLDRRNMLGKLAGIAGAFVGLTAFRRIAPIANAMRAPK